MDIEVTHNRAHRVERCQKALRIASTMAGLHNGQIDALISRLVDDRGHLTIYWRYPPSELQRLAWASAWAECKESADRITHISE